MQEDSFEFIIQETLKHRQFYPVRILTDEEDRVAKQVYNIHGYWDIHLRKSYLRVY